MAGSWSPCRDAGNSFKELGGERVIFNKPTKNVQEKDRSFTLNYFVHLKT